jgi:uncharacterized protein
VSNSHHSSERGTSDDGMSQENLKILIAGSVGSGKTTSIRAISDIEPFSTEEMATDSVRLVKRTTTVAMDYGYLTLDETTKVHIYGTPGQTRFSFMWEILSEGAIGVIVLISNSAPDPLAELRDYINHFSHFAALGALVVGITRNDIGNGRSVARYRAALGPDLSHIPMFAVDPRDHSQVIALVKALIYQIDPFTSKGDAP